MVKLFQALAVYDIWAVILITVISFAILLGMVEWIKKTWAKREAFKQENIERGKRLEAEAEAREARLVHGEARMDALEANVQKLTALAEAQQKMIELLIQSDELDIKSWIKAQHERWIPLGCIDSQTLELLEQRYSIYTKEGGNSWAEKLVKELRALPTVVNLPINEIHDSSLDKKQ